MTAWDEVEPPALPARGVGGRIRLGLRAAWAVVALAALFAVFLGLRWIDWLGERAAGRPVTRLGAAVVRAWAALALPTLGLRYVAHGAPMAGPGAFVANHSSWLDIVALQRAAAPFLVSKAEVRGWPVIGVIGRAIGTMFIDRRPAEAKRQEAELQARLSRGDRMALFPEGTSTDGSRVLPFKSSLFAGFFADELRERVHVQPVTIRYRPRPGLPSNFYGWWGGMDFAGHLKDLLALSTGGVVELTFHPPLRPADFPGRKALADRAGAMVREGFEAAPGRLPVRLALSPGEAHDNRLAGKLLSRLRSGSMLLADRGYDANWIRELAMKKGAWANIPPKRNRSDPICFSPYLYRARNRVERFFNRIKQCRRVATRYDKLAVNYLAFVQLASIRLWLRVNESAP